MSWQRMAAFLAIIYGLVAAAPIVFGDTRFILHILTMCLIWGGVAAWQFTNMQRELRTMLDDRLIASARMVAGIVVQFQPMQLHGF